MGVSSLINRVAYSGNGVTTSFSFPYYFFETSDLKVYEFVTATGIATLKSLGADYSVSGTPNSQGLYPNGGSVVMDEAPETGVVLIIYRDPPRVQDYSLLYNSEISSFALVQQMDYLTLLVQRLQDEVSRAVKLPDGFNGTFDIDLPSTIALNPSKYLQVNDDGDGWTLSDTVEQTPVYRSVQIPYTDVQAAALTNQVELFDLPPGAILTSIVAKHTTAFSGGAISSVAVDIGPASDYTSFVYSFDVDQTVSDTAFENVVPNKIQSWADPTTIFAQFTAIGADLDELTQGSLTVFYGYLPVAS